MYIKTRRDSYIHNITWMFALATFSCVFLTWIGFFKGSRGCKLIERIIVHRWLFTVHCTQNNSSCIYIPRATCILYIVHICMSAYSTQVRKLVKILKVKQVCLYSFDYWLHFTSTINAYVKTHKIICFVCPWMTVEHYWRCSPSPGSGSSFSTTTKSGVWSMESGVWIGSWSWSWPAW